MIPTRIFIALLLSICFIILRIYSVFNEKAPSQKDIISDMVILFPMCYFWGLSLFLGNFAWYAYVFSTLLSALISSIYYFGSKYVSNKVAEINGIYHNENLDEVDVDMLVGKQGIIMSDILGDNGKYKEYAGWIDENLAVNVLIKESADKGDTFTITNFDGNGIYAIKN